MLKRCGDKALEQSSAHANELTGDGDHDAADTWRRITTAVAQLANTTQPAPPHSSDRTRNGRIGASHLSEEGQMARVRSAADAVGERTGMRRAQLAVRRSQAVICLGPPGGLAPQS